MRRPAISCLTCCLSRRTAHKAINLLVSLGILLETTGKARDRAYVYRQYFRPVGPELMARLARATFSNTTSPAITSLIIGPRTLDRPRDNSGAMDVTFSEGDRQQID